MGGKLLGWSTTDTSPLSCTGPPADVGEMDDGEPTVTDPAFILVNVNAPDERYVIAEGDQDDWDAALEAARADYARRYA